MIVAGHQPNYLPWLGFFDKMARCDVFIIEDYVQFERQGFQNRTKIKTFEGAKWLTVPLRKETKSLPICEVRIANDTDGDWAKKHWLMLKGNYSRAPYWGKFCSFFEQAFALKWEKLMDLNMHFIRGIMGLMAIEKPLIMASSLNVSGRKSDLVLAQCKALKATTLLSGVGAREYLDVERFEKEGIKVVFQDFQHPVYPQLGTGFVSNLSVVDYLFWKGMERWSCSPLS